ncbi:PREDICTED: protein TRM32 [Tarenaya hassleriana]|uniref:protein TRM32 n=1 Tax=Tarenaya hassleriana TaxID=28532 RepID=UPI00053C1EBF|nr:PREDICTED: protein TRM32 [Tarenaya hassleriana]XP_010521836.1 PREDICTED: protein TRM32 [Tarenaya hassleriana]XP_010521837.1 PREDICTED: protein TRM32 [Tarenaya hassleriana]
MGKRLKNEESSPGSGKYDHKQGWLAGMLHVFDYHHWRTKHCRKHHRPVCWGTPRTHSLVREFDEKQRFLNPPMDDPKRIEAAGRPNRLTKLNNKTGKDLQQKQHVQDYVDIIEILENKEIFVKILKNRDSGLGKQFQIKQSPRNLTKSGSFPLPGSSRASSLRPTTTLEHKKKEHWRAPKEESSVLTLYVPRFGVSISPKEQNPISPSSYSSGRSDDHGFSHAVKNGFRGVKNWLKSVIKDKKNKRKLPPARRHEKGDVGREEYRPVRRAISLNDSLERYSQLMEQSSRREAGLHSKSLKLLNEENKSASRSDKPRFFRRISSLSSLESLGSFLTELSHDSTASSNPETGKSSFGTKRSASQKNAVHETESSDTKDFLERPISSEESAEAIPTASEFLGAEAKENGEEEKERSHEDHREVIPEIPDRETEGQDPDSVPGSGSSENAARKSETLLSKGSDPNSSDFRTNAHGSWLGSQSKSNFQNDQEELFAELKNFNHEDEQEEEEEDTYLRYVKNVLELSGFLEGQWHSEDQPLNPSLLCKLEPCTREEDDELLFHLVNEAILETHNQSHTYFPRAFSFSRHVYSTPTGKHLLEKVWGRVQWSLSGMRADDKRDCSLDDLVGRDLGKADGWMKVQAEAEWLALELEDLIFYEILDELVCVCS